MWGSLFKVEGSRELRGGAEGGDPAWLLHCFA